MNLTKNRISFLLSFLFLGQSILAPLAEASIWEDRKKAAVQVAALPSILSLPSAPISAVLNDLPKIKRPNSSFLPNRYSSKITNLISGLPLNAVRLQQVQEVKGSGRPAVVLIQDVHLNTEAQKNIAAAIESLMKKELISGVAVEGAFGNYDFSFFDYIKNRHIVHNVALAYLEQNLLSAPAYAALTGPRSSSIFRGVDDETHHQRNVQAYLTSRPLQNEWTERLADQKKHLEKTQAQLSSPVLTSFARLQSGLDNKSLGFAAYVEQLSKFSDDIDLEIERFLGAYQLEKSLDFEKVQQQRAQAMVKLSEKTTEEELQALLSNSVAFRSGQVSFGAYYAVIKKLCQDKGVSLSRFPAFEDYIRYVLLADSVRADELFDSVDRCEKNIVRNHAATPSDRRYFEESQRIRLTEKLIKFELTPKEWEEYRRHSGLDPESSLTTNDWIPAFAGMTSFESFYREADIRSRKMVENLLSSFPKFSIGNPHRSPIKTFGDDATVLVTGGYHTTLITQLLKEKEISSVVVSPVLTKVDSDSGSSYLSLFAREKTPLDQLFAGEKLFLSHSGVAGVGTAHPSALANTNRLVVDTVARAEEAGDKYPEDGPLEVKKEGDHEVRVAKKDGSFEATVKTDGKPGDDFQVSTAQKARMWVSGLANHGKKMMALVPGTRYSLQMAKRKDVEHTFTTPEGQQVKEEVGEDQGFLPEFATALAEFHYDAKTKFPKANFTLRDLMSVARFIRLNAEFLGLGGAFVKAFQFVYEGRLSVQERITFEGMLKPIKDKVATLGDSVKFQKEQRITVETASRDLTGYVRYLIQSLPQDEKTRIESLLEKIDSNEPLSALPAIEIIYPLAVLDNHLMMELVDKLVGFGNSYRVSDERAFNFLWRTLELYQLVDDSRLQIFKGDIKNLTQTFEYVDSTYLHFKRSQSIFREAFEQAKAKMNQDSHRVENFGNRIVRENGTLTIGDARISVNTSKDNDPTIPNLEDLDPVTTENLLANMEAIAFADQGNFSLLLDGVTALGKSFAVKVVAALKRQSLAVVGMNKALTSYEMIGGYHPVGEAAEIDPEEVREELKVLQEEAERTGQWALLEEALEQIGIWPPEIQSKKSAQQALKEALTPDKSQKNGADVLALREYIQSKKENRRPKLEWKKGFLINAMENNQWLVLEELNLAATEVLEALNLYLVHGKLLVRVRGGVIEYSVAKGNVGKNFRIFATKNPDHYTSREPTSEALLNRFIHRIVTLGPEEEERELMAIGQHKIGLDPVWLRLFVKAHMGLVTRAKTWRQGAESREPYEFNVRHLLRFAHLLKNQDLHPTAWSALSDEDKALRIAGVFWEVYGDSLKSPARRTELFQLLEELLPFAANVTEETLNTFYPEETAVIIKEGKKEALSVGGVKLTRGPPNHPDIPGIEHEQAPTTTLRRIQAKLARALALKPKGRSFISIFLSGPPAASKTSVVFDFFRKLQKPLHYINLHGTIDYEALVGGYVPSEKKGRYEYQEGILVRAAKHGEAVFLDELNLSEMPEWFNTLMDEGILYLPGQAEPVIAKEGFMIIAAGNQATEESRAVMSPALRSRFKEIVVHEISDPKELQQIAAFKLSQAGIEDTETLAATMVEIHLDLQKKHPKAGIGLRNLLYWTDFIRVNQDDLGRGLALKKGLELHYGGLLKQSDRAKLSQYDEKFGDVSEVKPLDNSMFDGDYFKSREGLLEFLEQGAPLPFRTLFQMMKEIISHSNSLNEVRAFSILIPYFSLTPILQRIVMGHALDTLKEINQDREAAAAIEYLTAVADKVSVDQVEPFLLQLLDHAKATGEPVVLIDAISKVCTKASSMNNPSLLRKLIDHGIELSRDTDLPKGNFFFGTVTGFIKKSGFPGDFNPELRKMWEVAQTLDDKYRKINAMGHILETAQVMGDVELSTQILEELEEMSVSARGYARQDALLASAKANIRINMSEAAKKVDELLKGVSKVKKVDRKIALLEKIVDLIGQMPDPELGRIQFKKVISFIKGNKDKRIKNKLLLALIPNLIKIENEFSKNLMFEDIFLLANEMGGKTEINLIRKISNNSISPGGPFISAQVLERVLEKSRMIGDGEEIVAVLEGILYAARFLPNSGLAKDIVLKVLAESKAREFVRQDESRIIVAAAQSVWGIMSQDDARVILNKALARARRMYREDYQAEMFSAISQSLSMKGLPGSKKLLDQSLKLLESVDWFEEDRPTVKILNRIIDAVMALKNPEEQKEYLKKIYAVNKKRHSQESRLSVYLHIANSLDGLSDPAFARMLLWKMLKMIPKISKKQWKDTLMHAIIKKLDLITDVDEAQRFLTKIQEAHTSYSIDIDNNMMFVIGNSLRTHSSLPAEIQNKLQNLEIQIKEPQTGTLLQGSAAERMEQIQFPQRQSPIHPDDAENVPSLEKLKPVYTPGLVDLLEKVLFAVKGGLPFLIEGFSALGKSFAIKVAAAHAKQPLVTVGMHGAMSSYELIGGYRPKVFRRSSEEAVEQLAQQMAIAEQRGWRRMQNALRAVGIEVDAARLDELKEVLGKMAAHPVMYARPLNALLDLLGGEASNLVWEDGILLTAMERGQWLVLEELNLAPSEVSELLNLYLTQKRLVIRRAGKQVIYSVANGKIHADFRLFFTQNPEQMGGGRFRLAKAFLSRLVRWFVDLSPEQKLREWKEIFMARFGFQQGFAEQVVSIHQELINESRTWVGAASSQERYEFNLRHLLRLGRRLELREEKEGKKFADMDQFESALYLAAELSEVYGDVLRDPQHRAKFWEVVGQVLKFEELGFTPEDVETVYPPQEIENAPADLAPIDSTRRVQGKIIRSLALDEHVLLTGQTGAGKTSLIIDYFHQIKQKFFYYNMHGSATFDELVGSSHPTGRPGEYEFVPGILPQAMEAGVPLIIDELNLSQLPEWFNTVMDDGVLYLPDGTKVVAKKGFTLIAAMNPPTGDYSTRAVLSAALRSRFREIWVNEITDPAELQQIAEFKLRKIPSLGTKHQALSTSLVDIHQKLREEFPKAQFGLRRLLGVIECIEEFEDEMGLERAIVNGFHLFYKDKLGLDDKERFDELTKSELMDPFWSVPVKKIEDRMPQKNELEEKKSVKASEVPLLKSFHEWLAYIVDHSPDSARQEWERLRKLYMGAAPAGKMLLLAKLLEEQSLHPTFQFVIIAQLEELIDGLQGNNVGILVDVIDVIASQHNQPIIGRFVQSLYERSSGWDKGRELALLSLARFYYSAGDVSRANAILQSLHRAVVDRDNDFVIYTQVADLRFKMGKPELSLEPLEKAVESVAQTPIIPYQHLKKLVEVILKLPSKEDSERLLDQIISQTEENTNLDNKHLMAVARGYKELGKINKFKKTFDGLTGEIEFISSIEAMEDQLRIRLLQEELGLAKSPLINKFNLLRAALKKSTKRLIELGREEDDIDVSQYLSNYLDIALVVSSESEVDGIVDEILEIFREYPSDYFQDPQGVVDRLLKLLIKHHHWDKAMKLATSNEIVETHVKINAFSEILIKQAISLVPSNEDVAPLLSKLSTEIEKDLSNAAGEGSAAGRVVAVIDENVPEAVARMRAAMAEVGSYKTFEQWLHIFELGLGAPLGPMVGALRAVYQLSSDASQLRIKALLAILPLINESPTLVNVVIEAALKKADELEDRDRLENWITIAQGVRGFDQDRASQILRDVLAVIRPWNGDQNKYIVVDLILKTLDGKDPNLDREFLQDLLTQARTLQDSLEGPWDRPRALISIARVLKEAGDTESSVEILNEALPLARLHKTGDHRMEILLTIAQSLQGMNDVQSLEILNQMLGEDWINGRRVLKSKILSAMAPIVVIKKDTSVLKNLIPWPSKQKKKRSDPVETLPEVLQVARGIPDRELRVLALVDIAQAYQKTNKSMAKKILKEALELAVYVEPWLTTPPNAKVLIAVAKALENINKDQADEVWKKAFKDPTQILRSIAEAFQAGKDDLALRALNAVSGSELPTVMRHQEFQRGEDLSAILRSIRGKDDAIALPVIRKVFTIVLQMDDEIYRKKIISNIAEALSVLMKLHADDPYRQLAIREFIETISRPLDQTASEGTAANRMVAVMLETDSKTLTPMEAAIAEVGSTATIEDWLKVFEKAAGEPMGAVIGILRKIYESSPESPSLRVRAILRAIPLVEDNPILVRILVDQAFKIAQPIEHPVIKLPLFSEIAQSLEGLKEDWVAEILEDIWMESDAARANDSSFIIFLCDLARTFHGINEDRALDLWSQARDLTEFNTNLYTRSSDLATIAKSLLGIDNDAALTLVKLAMDDVEHLDEESLAFDSLIAIVDVLQVLDKEWALRLLKRAYKSARQETTDWIKIESLNKLRRTAVRLGDQALADQISKEVPQNSDTDWQFYLEQALQKNDLPSAFGILIEAFKRAEDYEESFQEVLFIKIIPELTPFLKMMAQDLAWSLAINEFSEYLQRPQDQTTAQGTAGDRVVAVMEELESEAEPEAVTRMKKAIKEVGFSKNIGEWFRILEQGLGFPYGPLIGVMRRVYQSTNLAVSLRVRILLNLAAIVQGNPLLRDYVMDWALAEARTETNERSKAEMLVMVARLLIERDPLQANGILEEALEESVQIRDERSKVVVIESIAELTRKLNQEMVNELIQKIIDLIPTIMNESDKSRLYADVLKAIQGWERTTVDPILTRIVNKARPFTDKWNVSKVMRVAASLTVQWDAKAAEGYIDEALEATAQIRIDEEHRESLQSTQLKHIVAIVGEWEEKRQVKILNKVLIASRSLKDGRYKAEVLVPIARIALKWDTKRAQGLMRTVIKTAKGTEDQSHKIEGLFEVLKGIEDWNWELNHEIVDQVLDLGLEIAKNGEKPISFFEQVRNVISHWGPEKAQKIVLKILDEEPFIEGQIFKRDLLSVLAEFVRDWDKERAENILLKILEKARQFAPEYRAVPLFFIAASMRRWDAAMSQQILTEFWETIDQIEHPQTKENVLRPLLHVVARWDRVAGEEFLRKVFKEAQKEFRGGDNLYNFALPLLEAMKLWDKNSPNTLLRDIFAAVRQMESQDNRTSVLLWAVKAMKLWDQSEALGLMNEVLDVRIPSGRSDYHGMVDEIEAWVKDISINSDVELALAEFSDFMGRTQNQTAAQGKDADRVVAVMEETELEKPAGKEKPKAVTPVGRLYIGETSLPILPNQPGKNVPSMRKLRPVMVKSLVDIMEKAAMAVRLNKMAVFVGRTALGKSFGIKVLAADKDDNFFGTGKALSGTNHPYRAVGMYPSLTTYEMLGGYHPTDGSISFAESKEIFGRLVTQAKKTGNYSRIIRVLTEAGVRELVRAPADPSSAPVIDGKLLESLIDRLLTQKDPSSTELLRTAATLIAGSRATLEWENGFIVDAAEAGEWLVLEELNMASTEVLEVLNYYLVFGKLNVLKAGKWVEIDIDPEFRLFATMNPDDYQGRMKVSRALLDRMIEFNVALSPDQMEKELVEILQALYGFQEGWARLIAQFHMSYQQAAVTWRGTYASKEPYEFNLRHLLRFGDRIEELVIRFARAEEGLTREEYLNLVAEEKSKWMERWKESLRDADQSRHAHPDWAPFRALAAEMWEVYADPLRDIQYQKAPYEPMDVIFGLREKGISEEDVNVYRQEQDPEDGVLSYNDLLDYYSADDLKGFGCRPSDTSIAVLWVGGVPLLKGEGRLAPSPEHAARVPEQGVQIPLVDTTRKFLGKIARSVFRGEHLMLVGLTSAGKTSMVFELFRRLNRPLFYINFHEGVDIDELLGGKQLMPDGSYKFVDGILPQAMEAGGALFVDELNLSDAPEWFNTMMDDGVLWLPNGRKVVAKPGFVIIGSINPPRLAGRKVLSPALRSRFREIWVDEVVVIAELKEILMSVLNGIGSVWSHFAVEPWHRALKTTSKLVSRLPVSPALMKKWGLRMDALTAEEKDKIREYLSRNDRHFSPSELNTLMQKAEDIKARAETMINMIGRDRRKDSKSRRISVVPGEGWAYNFETDSVSYPVYQLFERSVESIVAVAIHEAAHRDISRIDPYDRKDAAGNETNVFKFFYEKEIYRVLLNAFEDPRVNNWEIARFQGVEHLFNVRWGENYPQKGTPQYKEFFKDSILAKAGVEIKDEAPGEPGTPLILPHMQYALGVVHWWRHREVPEWVTDEDAISMLKEDGANGNLQDIFYRETLPIKSGTAFNNDRPNPKGEIDPTSLFGEKAKMDLARKHAQIVKDRIVPRYEKLLEKSREQVKKMMEDAKKNQQGGQEGQEGQEGQQGQQNGEGQSGQSGGPQGIEGIIDDILEKNAAGVANDLEGKDEIPQVREAKNRARAASKGKPQPATATTDPKKPKGAPSGLDVIQTNLDLNRRRRAAMTPYQKYLERVVDATDRLRGVLGNIFFKNSKPRDVGFFRSGKINAASIVKIMKGEATGFMNESDMKIFVRRILPQLRNHKLTLVIDQSGSMDGIKGRAAMEATVLFMETLEYLGIDYNIIGFSDAPSEYKEFNEGKLDEDARNNRVVDIEMGNRSGATNDEAALGLAVDKMEAQGGDQKVIIVISDGQGTHGPVAGQIKRAREQGIRVILIPIGGEALQYAKDNYGEGNYIPSTKIDDIPELVGEVLEQEILGTPEITPAIQEFIQQLTSQDAADKTTTVATIPAILYVMEKVFGPSWAPCLAVALETLMFGALPAFVGDIYWMGAALVIFTLLHLPGREWMAKKYGLEPELLPIGMVVTMHLIGMLALPFSIPLWVLIGFIHLIGVNSYEADSPTQSEFLSLVNSSDLSLGVGEMIPQDRSRFYTFFRSLLTNEKEDAYGLTAGPLRNVIRDLPTDSIRYIWLDPAHPELALRQAQLELDEMAQEQRPIKVAFMGSDDGLLNQLKAQTRVSSHLQVEYFNTTQVRTIRDTVKNGFISEEDYQERMFSVIAPASMKASVKSFFDVPGLDSERVQIFLLVTETLNAIAVEFRLDQLDSLDKRKLDLIRSQA